MALQELDIVLRETNGGSRHVHFPFATQDECHLGIAQSRRGLYQRIQHRLQVEGRAADDLEHVADSGLLLKRLAEIVGALTQFLEQPGVLDGDHGLLGEILDQGDLLVCERLHFLAKDCDRTDQFLFLQHRYDHQRPGPGDLHHPDHVGNTSKVSRALPHVINLGELVRLDDGLKRGAWIRVDRRPLPESRERRRNVVIRSDIEFLAIPEIHRAKRRSADTRGILKHLPEHRLQFARRRADDLQYFRGRGLLLQRLSQIIRALTQFLEQPRILNGDHSLLGKILDQRDLLVGERPNLLAIDRNCADQLVFL